MPKTRTVATRRNPVVLVVDDEPPVREMLRLVLEAVSLILYGTVNHKAS